MDKSQPEALSPSDFGSYSGLIVLLAMAATAILLYWLIIAPTRESVDDYRSDFDAFSAVNFQRPSVTELDTKPVEDRPALPDERLAVPKTVSLPAADPVQLPAQLPMLPEEVEPEFNDASARAYPETEHPNEWDWASLFKLQSAGDLEAVFAPSFANDPKATSPTQTLLKR